MAEALVRLSFNVVNMGSFVREEVERRGLEPNDENLGRLMLTLREERGGGAIAELCLPKILGSGPLIVVDGVRSLDEVEVFKRVGEVKILAVHASPEVRLHNLSRRGRNDAPVDMVSFAARDRRELSVGIGVVIAQADGMIVNEGVTLRGLRRRGLSFARRWLRRLED